MKLVSAIMPSMRSPEIVEQAIRCFQGQSYAQRELVILRSDAIDDLAILRRMLGCVLGDWPWQITRVPAGLSIGELRNVACREARGSIFVHLDDDDWSAPDRIERSVAALENADVTGTSLVRYYDTDARKWWLWDGNLQAEGEQARLGGCTLAYRRRVWERHKFDHHLEVGEDTIWQRDVSQNGFTFADLRDEAIFAARMHSGNTSAKHPYAPVWTEMPFKEGVF